MKRRSCAIARRHRERRDHAQRLLDLREREAEPLGGAHQSGGHVHAREIDEARRRDAEHDALEIGFERGEQRGRVAAERDAVDADRRRALAAQPAEQASQIPHRLRLRVDRVEEVARQIAVAAATTDACAGRGTASRRSRR